MEIKVMTKVLAANDAWAAENRKLLRAQGTKMLNFIGSPGAGKTALLEETIAQLKGRLRIGVIEGDIATTKDAQRIMQQGVPVLQINTGTACHLGAHLINQALLDLTAEAEFDLIIVENIGNLVCPAEFDIGEDAKIAVLSVTEGDDKIEKYPLLFSKALALVVSKLDLLPYTNFKLDFVRGVYQQLNEAARIYALDSLSGHNFEPWITFIEQEVMQPEPGAAS